MYSVPNLLTFQRADHSRQPAWYCFCFLFPLLFFQPPRTQPAPWCSQLHFSASGNTKARGGIVHSLLHTSTLGLHRPLSCRSIVPSLAISLLCAASSYASGARDRDAEIASRPNQARRSLISSRPSLQPCALSALPSVLASPSVAPTVKSQQCRSRSGFLSASFRHLERLDTRTATLLSTAPTASRLRIRVPNFLRASRNKSRLMPSPSW